MSGFSECLLKGVLRWTRTPPGYLSESDFGS